jgi:hypothetical protein
MSIGIRHLDHIAVRVADRDAWVAHVHQALGFSTIEHTERLTLLGVDDAGGKLTLLDAPAEPAMQPADQAIVTSLHLAGTAIDPSLARRVRVAGAHIVVESVESDWQPGTIIGATIAVPNVADAVQEAAMLLDGEGAHPDVVHMGPHWLRYVERTADDTGPAFDHVGVLVRSIEKVEQWLGAEGLDQDRVEAARSSAIFTPVAGRARVEYIELHRMISTVGSA